MKSIKLIAFFAIVSFVFASCSLGGGHTRCAAYTMNEPSNDWFDDVDQVNSKEYREADLVY